MTQTFIAYKATIKLRISLLPMSLRKNESSNGKNGSLQHVETVSYERERTHSITFETDALDDDDIAAQFPCCSPAMSSIRKKMTSMNRRRVILAERDIAMVVRCH